MSIKAIRAKNLGKRYRLGQHEPYKTFRDALTKGIRMPFGRLAKNANNGSQYFWALKDVSFEIEPGNVVGIIGRNGAGKSTLLKILSKIAAPTTGSIQLRGRVGSLLEVGTGFHPELTGRENIYLSGSILGMKRREIDDRFDQIVKFSEVEKFLDTPAKRYSSGMYVRLAFAVAAHLEPEILLVDEVLAVGDAGFQKKCLGKMKEVSGEGRTVLFVSHNMNAIEQLCESCIMLESGQLKKYDDNVREIVKEYLFGAREAIPSPEWKNTENKSFNPWFNLLRFFIGDENGKVSEMPISNDTDAWIYIEGEISELDPLIKIGYAIYNEDGLLIYWSYHTDVNEEKWIELSKGISIIRSKIPKHLLNERVYRVEFISSLHNRKWLFEPGTATVSLVLIIQGGLSDSPYWMSSRPGLLAPIMNYELVK
jgi:lipopolysaccharide transport system ATP-binding protein